MPNYNLNILQPAEFEDLVRDLLQKQLGVFVESFTIGRDSGIDLRFANVNGDDAIVQAKRYKDYKSLLSNLKKETIKVRNINPKSYYVATSVGLTPQNKDEIKELFHPYIKNTSNILGSDDINNMLGTFGDIEKKHYKLWLASTNILQSIINKDAINWSNFELENIRQQITTYVPNDSLDNAKDILKQYNYVIISGIPGIGKTTLANILVYDYLAHGYEEFVNIPGDIDNASKLFDANKKQVFFFDDFLGANVFENNGSGFARKLISFIRTIKNDNSKKFILTTREYILHDANLHYEKMRDENIEIAKCILDIGSYTKSIRAKILYNHMANANLPKDYVLDFLKGKEYKWIINHQNFNPRVIETFIDRQQWKQVSAPEFMNRFKELFSNPHMVWEMAFNNLKSESQYALLVLASMGNMVSLENWYIAYSHFCKTSSEEVNLRFDSIIWTRIIKILHDCFIKTKRSKNLIIVSFYNPSVRDFIVNYIGKNQHVQKLLIEGAMYPEQLTYIYEEDYTKNIPELFGSNNIAIAKHNIEILNKKFIEFLNDNPESCGLNTIFDGYIVKDYDKTSFIKAFATKFPNNFKKIQHQLFQTLREQIIENNDTNFYQRIQLVKMVDWSDNQLELRNILKALLLQDKDIDDCYEYLKILYLTKNMDLAKDMSFITKLEKEMINDMNEKITSVDEYEDYEQLYYEIKGMLPFRDALNDAFSYLEKIGSSLEDKSFPHYDEDDNQEYFSDKESEDYLIDRLMESLLQ